MINTPETKAAAERMIESFVSNFHNRFGVSPIVVYDTDIGSLGYITLNTIMEEVNKSLQNYDPKYKETTILERSRKRAICIHRQLYFYIARAYNYSLHLIGDSVGYDHATVLHGFHTIDNLVTNGTDPELKFLLATIRKALEERIKTENKEENGKAGSSISNVSTGNDHQGGNIS